MINKIFDYKNQKGIAYNFRKKRSLLIKKIIDSIFKKKNSVSIVDFGGTEIFWKIIGSEYLLEKNVKITLVNLEDYEVRNKEIFNFIKKDATCIDCKDNQYDFSFSNSVIEHLRDYEKMFDFGKEMKRVAEIFYCQTPNFWFPIEPHFFFPCFHFFPDPFKMKLVKNFSLGHYNKAKNDEEAIRIINDAKLLTKEMLMSFFGEGQILKEKFFFLNKSLIISNYKEMKDLF